MNFNHFNFIPIGAVVLNEKFVVMHWNHCMESWSQVQSTEIVNTQIKNHFPQFSETRYLNRLQNVLQSGFNATFSSLLNKDFMPLTLPDGEKSIHNITASRLHDEETNKNYLLLTIQNLNEIERRNQKIKQIQMEALSSARRSNQAFEDFSYLISNDLKTPLRGIKTFAEIVRNDKKNFLSMESKMNLHRIESLVMQMRDMIESLFAYSKMDREVSHLSEYPVQALILNAMEKSRPLIEKTQSEVKLLGDFPSLFCDKERIIELFCHLIENAVVHNQNEKKMIEIGQDIYKSQAFFYIKDNGDGIPEEYHKSIFQMFQTAESQETGIGSGLAMAKKIIDRHNGEIYCESEVGRGTTIYFQIGDQKAAAQAS